MDALKKHYPEYLEDEGIKWDFTKFLIDHEGNVVERYEPITSPSAMLAAIEKFGFCPLHRKSFNPVKTMLENLNTRS